MGINIKSNYQSNLNRLGKQEKMLKKIETEKQFLVINMDNVNMIGVGRTLTDKGTSLCVRILFSNKEEHIMECKDGNEAKEFMKSIVKIT